MQIVGKVNEEVSIFFHYAQVSFSVKFPVLPYSRVRITLSAWFRSQLNRFQCCLRLAQFFYLCFFVDVLLGMLLTLFLDAFFSASR